MTPWNQRLSMQTLKRLKKYRSPVSACILVVLSLMSANANYNTGNMAYAEEGVIPPHVTTHIEFPFGKPSPTGPFPNEGDPWSSSGYFNMIWGDGPEGATQTIYTLTDDHGKITPLLVDETLSRSLGGVLWLDRKKVNVDGVWAISPSAQGAATGLKVTSISLAPPPETGILSDDVSPDVIGSKPWVTIMCKFSDVAAEPHDLLYFTGMYANTKPGLDHYWRELSYNTVDVVGSNAYGWFVLPYPEAYYNPTDTQGGTDLSLLATDCIAAANGSVNFALYQTGGINMMFNTDFDNGYAWGGSRYMTLDGVSQSWRTTWEPPWAYANISVIQHEMGHGFGLPHSSGAYGATYDNAWDVMSKDRYNCAAATDPTYGCIAQHTISYHKDRLGWIPVGQKFTPILGSSTMIILEQLALPETANYKMAQIPIGGSTTHFYTVEARRLTGYDTKLAGAAVIIHEVDTARSRPAYVIDPDLNGVTSDAGAMWVVGEEFIDAANNISVRVDSATATGFQITIGDHLAPTVQFSVASSSGSETVTPASIAVTLSTASGQTVTVSYATANGTATAGSDYTGTSGTLTFNPGVTSQAISVPILNDTAVEGNEAFTVTLSVPVNATLGAITTHTYTIIDDDFFGTLQFSSAAYSVNENGGSVTITVTRAGGSSGAVGVSYATANGTAAAGSDYTATSGTLSWANEDSSDKTFSVPIRDDSVYEGNATVNLTLSNPTSGAALGSPSTAVLTIFENDLGLFIIYVSKEGSCNGHHPCFPNIQNGIALASAPSIIKITQETYNENIILDLDEEITLEGGWDTNFTSNSSYTTIQGSITITHGPMILENIILK